jgi:hypothetical protein
MRSAVIDAMTRLALAALVRIDGWSDRASSFLAAGLKIDEILTRVVAEEGADNAISSRLYRILVSTPEVIALVGNPFLLKLATELGLAVPYPSTLPITRIDRPEDVIHKVPPHQDYWYSMVCSNSITTWFTYGRLDEDMGLLEVVPGSHKRGLIAFKQTDGGPNPFETVADEPEANYVRAPLPDDSLIVFHQMLLHRSGHNRSRNVRTSIQVRYNDVATADVVESTFRVDLAALVQQRQRGLVSGG